MKIGLLKSGIVFLVFSLIFALSLYAQEWESVVGGTDESQWDIDSADDSADSQRDYDNPDSPADSQWDFDTPYTAADSQHDFDRADDSADSREFILENLSAQNIHMFMDGDTFGPHNRVLPGKKRTVQGSGKIIAGRDGQILSTLMPGSDVNHITYRDGEGLKPAKAVSQKTGDLVLWGKQTRGVAGRNGTLDGNVLTLPFTGVIVDISGSFGQCGIRSADSSQLIKMNPQKGDILPAGEYTVLPEMKHTDNKASVSIRFEEYKKKKSDPEITIDPKKIERILFIPGALRAEPEKPIALPDIYGVHIDTGEQILLKDTDAVWSSENKAYVSGSSLTVKKNIKPGTTFKLKADVMLGFRRYTAEGQVEVVSKLVTGSVTGGVYYYYSKAERPLPSDWPRSPVSSVVVITGGNGVELRQNVGRDGRFSFKGIEKSNSTYYVNCYDVNTSNLPAGWESDTNQSSSKYWFRMPKETSKGEVWEVKVRCDWDVQQPADNTNCVYGTVTYKDEPVQDAVVILVGHMGSQMKQAITNRQGGYQINVDGLEGGNYTVTALKMMGENKRWAASDDLIGPVEAGQEVPKYIAVPLNDPRGVQVDITCLSRGDIYGAVDPKQMLPDGPFFDE